ncbi:MAG TPA: IS5 family transposase, partial [Armatimonadota bacterium]|nr:IS5 family transposase [Armatimonadota bacterium]
NLFVKINLEELVPADHPLRPIKRMADEALAAMSRTFTAAYAPPEQGGRPSIPPERLLKALVLMALYTVRSERALCERITFDLLFRWFLDMTPDQECFDHSDFTGFRGRLDALDITKKFSDRIVGMARDAGLLSEDHFTIDGSLIQSHASLKSLKHIEEIRKAAEARAKDRDGSDGPAGGAAGRPGSNAWVDFKGQKRSNKTHRSTTDPEARLYTKSSGQAALLCHSVHVLMENRHGLGVDIRVGKADGHAERKCCLKMLDRVKRRLGLEPATLGADKGYDSADFLLALEERGIEPHVSCKSKKEIDVPRENDEGAWARWHNQQGQGDEAFQVSQRKRKLDEEIFGWLKQFGGLRRARLVGRWKLQQLADLALGTLNLIRMSTLLKT